jgi:glutamine amidotransferase
MPRLAVLDYGMGNLRSVARAIEHVGGEGIVTGDRDEVAGADGLVVPGVGAFGACVSNLRAASLDEPVRAFVASGRPVLAVCLGMQVLFDRSDEGGGPGLGLLRGDVRHLPGSVKVPHMGWNDVTWTREHLFTAGIPDGTRFYFAHSYVCRPAEPVTIGESEHGGRFPAAIAWQNLFGAQFHPEKSGEAGLELYRNFVKAAS